MRDKVKENMKLAITGGAGFLGLHVAQALEKDFEEIRILDIAPISEAEYPPHCALIQADVRDFPRLSEAFKGVDFVVHAAAALPLWRKREIYEINEEGTRKVLEAARKNRVKRVIYISSTAVYGIPKKHPIEESDPLRGVGPYGKSKILAEKICEFFRQEGMCVPILRPKTFIGTGRLGVFQILYDWIQAGKRIPMIGAGTNRYQLLEVTDLVKAIRLLLFEPEEKVNDCFNIGAERFATVREDLNSVCVFAGTGAKALATPAWGIKPILFLFEKMKFSPLYQWVYATADKDSFVSTDKIRLRLGWAPDYSNAEALIKAYDWYLKNSNQISSVGVTHRVAWKQGILSFAKRFM